MSVLLSSLLAEVNQRSNSVSERERDSARLFSRLLSFPSETVQPLVPLLEPLLRSQSEKTRVLAWKLWALLLESHHRKEGYVWKKVSEMIEKQVVMQFIKDTCAFKVENSLLFESIFNGISAIFSLSLEVQDVSTSLDSQLNKMLSACLDQLSTSDTVDATATLFCLKILGLLIGAKGRYFTPHQLVKIVSICFQFLSNPSLQMVGSHVIALCASYGSCEFYEKLWLSISNECSRLLQELGMETKINELWTDGKKPEDSFNSLKLNVPSSGVHKALFIETSFAGLCETLAAISSTGNQSGPVVLQLNPAVNSFLGVAICRRPGSKNEATHTLENNAGISPAHVSIILPQLRLHALLLLSTLLGKVENIPLVYELSATACRCITSSLLHVFPTATQVKAIEDSESFVETAERALDCFQQCLGRFPTIVMAKCEVVIQKLVDAVCAQIQFVASYPVVSSENGGSGLFSSKKLLVSSFGACEMLLLTVSSLLPVQIRQQISLGVRQGLQCIIKGVLQPSFTAIHSSTNFSSCVLSSKHIKKMRRDNCEIIRSDTDLLKRFLLLASAEVQSYFVDGSRSTNLTLLKGAVEVCSALDSTAVVCGRIGLSLANILFPAGVGLPGPSLHEMVHKTLKEHTDASDRNTSSKGMSSHEKSAAQPVAIGNVPNDLLIKNTNSSRKRKPDDNNVSIAYQSNEIESQDLDLNDSDVSGREPPIKTAKTGGSVDKDEDWIEESVVIQPKPGRVENADSDSSDDDLPDINVDADLDD